MARPQKIAEVDYVKATFAAAKSVVLIDFTGLDVAQITDLRQKCRAAGVEMRVVKNTLAKRGIAGTGAESLSSHFQGPTAIASSTEFEHVGAKVVATFAKGNEHERPKFKAGFVDGAIISATQVKALSELPSREELVSKLLGCLLAPGNGLVACLQGPLRNLLSVMNQVKDREQS